ncbi:MAG: hypothetical protein EBQ89_10045, partial [Alphaproteobacteria bacterium]|nr:hypothetical protein [Alphaproteobacteria bacterium]
TFYGQAPYGGDYQCTPGEVKSNQQGLDQIMANFVQNIEDPIRLVVLATGWILGIFFIARGLFKAARFSADPNKNSITNITANITIGAFLVFFSETGYTWLETFFGNDEIAKFSSLQGTKAYQYITTNLPGQSTAVFNRAVEYALRFIQLIGLIAFIRGWVMIKHAAESFGQQTVGQGLVHVIGGIIALNIFKFLEIADRTFGL